MKYNIESKKLCKDLASAVNQVVATDVEKRGAMAEYLESEQEHETKVSDALMKPRNGKMGEDDLCALINSSFKEAVEKSFWSLDSNLKQFMLEKGDEYSIEEKLKFIVTTVDAQEEIRKIIIEGCNERYQKAINGWKEANKIAQQGVEIVQKLSKEKEEIDRYATTMTKTAEKLSQKCVLLGSRCQELETKCYKNEGKLELYKELLDGLLQKLLFAQDSDIQKQITATNETQESGKVHRELSPYDKLLKMIIATHPKNPIIVTNSLRELRENHSLENKINGESLVTVACEMIGVLKDMEFYGENVQNIELAETVKRCIKPKHSLQTLATYIGRGKSSNRKIIMYFRSELHKSK